MQVKKFDRYRYQWTDSGECSRWELVVADAVDLEGDIDVNGTANLML
ncbi:MAG: hypothetical protein CM15mP44_6570 [Candidatus Neomarinimicrobiota bacterium]|nr:MAG: hypothetical protein CM15mP44_6570 [Candidatus Neomarinimicrobiota bacterium]